MKISLNQTIMLFLLAFCLYSCSGVVEPKPDNALRYKASQYLMIGDSIPDNQTIEYQVKVELDSAGLVWTKYNLTTKPFELNGTWIHDSLEIDLTYNEEYREMKLVNWHELVNRAKKYPSKDYNLSIKNGRLSEDDSLTLGTLHFQGIGSYLDALEFLEYGKESSFSVKNLKKNKNITSFTTTSIAKIEALEDCHKDLWKLCASAKFDKDPIATDYREYTVDTKKKIVLRVKSTIYVVSDDSVRFSKVKTLKWM